MASDRIQTYKEFWPYYLREHSQKATRTWHAWGSSIAFALLLAFAVTLNYKYLVLALLSGYGFAWFSHFKIEKNRPATFRYPLWSFVSDWRMWFFMLTGQIHKELQKHGIGN